MSVKQTLTVPPTLARKDDADDVRIRACGNLPFIPYMAGNEILDRMEELFRGPVVLRMRCLLLMSKSDNGKSALVAEFLRRHPESRGVIGASADFIPALFVECPPIPSATNFFSSVLEELHPGSNERKIHILQRRIKALLEQVKTRFILLDEFQNSGAGRDSWIVSQLNAIKWLNNCGVNIVATGGTSSKDVLALDRDQMLASRFQTFTLPLWNPGKRMQELLLAIEKRLPLRKESKLWEPKTMETIHEMGDQTIGSIFSIVGAAAVQAIQNQTEAIYWQDLASLKWVKTSERDRIETILGLRKGNPKGDQDGVPQGQLPPRIVSASDGVELDLTVVK